MLRKISACLLALVLWTAASAAEPAVFAPASDFVKAFNASARTMKTGHRLEPGDWEGEPVDGGLTRCDFPLSPELTLSLYLPFDPAGEAPSGLCRAVLVFNSDGTAAAEEALLAAVQELILAAGGARTPGEAEDLILDLNFLENPEDGMTDSRTVNGLDYTYLYSSYDEGFLFTVAPAQGLLPGD